MDPINPLAACEATSVGEVDEVACGAWDNTVYKYPDCV